MSGSDESLVAKPLLKQRYVAAIEYDGSQFCGWQKQFGVSTVQECLQNALSRVANETIQVTGAGRTDTGVHALAQIVHFESQANRSVHQWVRGVNTNLPTGVAVQWVRPVHSDFHARFSALSRAYRYIFCNQSVKPAILWQKVTWEYRPLDATKMQSAANGLLGRHDFNALRAAACQANSSIRCIESISIQRSDKWVWMDVKADGFLHHMVRNIAGVLATIGCGEADVGWLDVVLASRDRRCAGVTAPAHGLYLTGVWYPQKYFIPHPPPPRRFW